MRRGNSTRRCASTPKRCIQLRISQRPPAGISPAGGFLLPGPKDLIQGGGARARSLNAQRGRHAGAAVSDVAPQELSSCGAAYVAAQRPAPSAGYRMRVRGTACPTFPDRRLLLRSKWTSNNPRGARAIALSPVRLSRCPRSAEERRKRAGADRYRRVAALAWPVDQEEKKCTSDFAPAFRTT